MSSPASPAHLATPFLVFSAVAPAGIGAGVATPRDARILHPEQRS